MTVLLFATLAKVSHVIENIYDLNFVAVAYDWLIV